MIDRLHPFEADSGPQAEQLKEQALEFVADARESLAGASETMRRSIVDQPVRALAIAFGMGIILGWIIKRR
jgi:hypothetical protein